MSAVARCVAAVAAVAGSTLTIGMASGTASAKSHPTACTGSLASGTYEDVVVPFSSSCTLGAGDIIRHDLTVDSRATLTDTGSSIGHDLKAMNPDHVSVSGGSVGHDLRVADATGTVSVTSERVGHDLGVWGSVGAAVVSDDDVSRDISVVNNLPGGATVEDDLDANCAQHGNTPFTGGGNDRAGSCNGANPVECTGTLAKGSYPNVTVPAGASCTMDADVNVQSNLVVGSGASLTDTGASIGHDVQALDPAQVSVSGGRIGEDVRVTRASGAVSVTQASVGHDLEVEYGQGAVTVSDNTVDHRITVEHNEFGGTTVGGNTDGACHVSGNYPYSGQDNNKPGNCDRD
ncbi:MAG TPA: hypothetical protein VK386_07280 [Acidimicrobiales bacterium]|nr:hypothetical protein [Acidimicrobiales bacterium]